MHAVGVFGGVSDIAGCSGIAVDDQNGGDYLGNGLIACRSVTNGFGIRQLPPIRLLSASSCSWPVWRYLH